MAKIHADTISNKIPYYLCKCLIVLSTCLIQARAVPEVVTAKSLETFCRQGPSSFAKGKIYREMRVSDGSPYLEATREVASLSSSYTDPS